MLYNYQLLKFFGANGVAAYGSIMYVNFVFVSAFIGYSIGTAPIIGYNYGSKNDAEMKNIFKKKHGSNYIIFACAHRGKSSPRRTDFKNLCRI